MRDLARLCGYLRKNHPSHWNPLERALDAVSYSNNRRVLSYIRVLGPLIEARDSAFVERCWSDLTDNELLQFVDAGITRERILLNRASDVDRAPQSRFRHKALWKSRCRQQSCTTRT
jgi:hypothetical protein